MQNRSANRKWKTRHTGDMEAKIHEAEVTLGLANHYMDSLAAYDCNKQLFCKEGINQQGGGNSCPYFLFRFIFVYYNIIYFINVV